MEEEWFKKENFQEKKRRKEKRRKKTTFHESKQIPREKSKEERVIFLQP